MQYIHRLNIEHNLDLIWNEGESPNKRRRTPGHEVTNAVRFLFFQDREALGQVEKDFRERLRGRQSQAQKLSDLLERLSIAKTECLKTRPTASSAKYSLPRGSTNANTPASPTQSVKHAPRYEMPAEDAEFLPPPRRGLQASLMEASRTASGQKARKRSSSHMGTMPNASPSITRPTSQKAAVAPESMPAMPSFTSNDATSAHTSFMSNSGHLGLNTSFWSEVQHGTQDQASPTTSVDSCEEHFTDAKSRQSGTGLDTLAADSVEGALKYHNDVMLDGAWDARARQSTQSGLSNLGSSPTGTPYEEFALQAEMDFSKERARQQVQQQLSSSNRTGESSDQDLTRFRHASQGTNYGDFPSQVDDDPPRPESPHKRRGLLRVQSIPSDGLTHLRLPSSFAPLRLDLRWEAMRVLQTLKITADDLDKQWHHPRTMTSLHKLTDFLEIEYEHGFATDFTDHSLAATLRWSEKSHGSVFRIQLRPPRKDKSNAFERKFGRSRFLVLDIPPLRKVPEKLDLGKHKYEVAKQVMELLKHEQPFLGHVWRQFLIQPKDKKPGDPDYCQAGAIQATFFAIRSENEQADPLSMISITALVDWAVQLDQNSRKPECKMYARLDLAASRTTATLEFARHEIAFVADQMPTDEPHDTRWDDPRLAHTRCHEKSKEPMSDGCSRISSWAMDQIRRMLELDYLPSWIQGRIFGSKGIWYRDDDVVGDPNVRPDGPLIWISESQIKVQQGGKSFVDADKLTFNVVKASTDAHPSFLYADFLQILADRGVPWAAIEKVIRDGINGMTTEFLSALPSRIELRTWFHRQNMFREERNRNGEIDNVGGFAVAREEQIVELLEAGFEPTECKFLATEVLAAFKQYCNSLRETFKAPIPDSTMLTIISDPTGKLKPGQIYVGLPSRFQDSQGRFKLHQVPALVARLPIMGRSDMQKVMCVHVEELSHLTNVIVFPSRGPYSLASELQGGDYDGDTVCVIWEQLLVEHFRNAPVPQSADRGSEFGVQHNTTLLSEMVRERTQGANNEEDIVEWMGKNTEARMGYNMLGTITLLHGKFIYHHNANYEAPAAIALLRLHDLMIDADKQGYTLSQTAWAAFKKKYNLNALDKQPPTAHDLFKGNQSKAPALYRNIEDHVYFNIVEPGLTDAIAKAEDNANAARSTDADLQRVFGKISQDTPKGGAIDAELQALAGKLEDLRTYWQMLNGEWRQKLRSWRSVLEQARTRFEAIMPNDIKSDLVKMSMQQFGNEPSMWDKLKALKLAGRAGFTPKLIFVAAGYELCSIKAHSLSNGRPRVMEAMSYNNVAPRKRKRRVLDAGDETDEMDEGLVQIPELP